MMTQKLNCKSCMAGDHGGCRHPENCLCAEDNHGVPDKSKIKMWGTDWRYHVWPKEEPREYEQALEDLERLTEIIDDGPGPRADPDALMIEMATLLIYTRHMISRLDLFKEIKSWCRIFTGVEGTDKSITLALNTVFADMDVFDNVKKIARRFGQRGQEVLFAGSQAIEAAEWIKGRFCIKRIELTGDLLFFNGQFYEMNAESQIRRSARERLAKCANKDVVEIVKYIEDTCDLIGWREIEKSIHLKCLLNGVYNIKTGIFSEEFDSDYIILNQIPHHYDEDVGFDGIDEKVRSLIPQENARQSYYDFLSTCLHPYTGVDYQFGSVGGTGTGKSQLGKLAELVLGEDNVGDATIHLIAKDQTTQKNMAFKMLNIDYDLNSESIKQIDVIKKWVTQDKFTGRGIYEHSTTFRPMSRLMFMANDLYEISNEDDAEAIYDRTYIIRVDRKFRHQSDEIKRVMEKTATDEELDGLITYLLKNAHWIHENESFHHGISVVDVENIWNTFGNRIKMFVKKWTEDGVGERFKTEYSELYNRWMSHCQKNNFKPKDKKRFSQIFNEIVGKSPTSSRIDGDNWYGYSGFRLKSEKEVADEEMRPFDTSVSS